jgi:hypothetical protein
MVEFYPLRLANIAYLEKGPTLEEELKKRLREAAESISLDVLSILDLDVDLVCKYEDEESVIKIRVYAQLEDGHEHLVISEQDIYEFIREAMEFEDYDADDLDLQRKTVIKLRDQLNELIAEIENLSAEGQTGND